MIIRQFVRRFFQRDLNAGLHPIKESESYVRFLESRFFEQGNPFRRLLLIDTNMNPLTTRYKIGRPEAGNPHISAAVRSVNRPTL